MKPNPNIIFFGTPTFALPALNALVDSKIFLPKLVVTQPDKPSGRGQKLTPSPIKIRGLELGIPVLQPTSLKGLILNGGCLETEKESLREFVDEANKIGEIDAAIVVAYGKIIPPALLELPTAGCINIHGSILPKWRGAAPIHRSLMNGDRETGISIMRLEEGLDTGPVYVTESIPITDEDNIGTLHDSLSQLGARLLVNNLSQIVEKTLHPVPQPAVGATYAEKWSKEDCKIRWQNSNVESWLRIRTCSPFPGATTSFEGEPIKVFNAELGQTAKALETPGTIVAEDTNGIVVVCSDRQTLKLTELQFAGKKRLPVSEILKSRSFGIGNCFE